MKIPAYARTRSKRFRAGTRRNKGHQIVLCPEPKLCLVHTTRPTLPASRIRLTACEQRWVDDVRAGRKHIHLTSKKREAFRHTRHRIIMQVLRNRNKGMLAFDGGYPNHVHLHYDRNMPTNAVPDQVLSFEEAHGESKTAVRKRLSSPTGRLITHGPAMQNLPGTPAATLERAIAEGRMRRAQSMDISDRWYPRGE